MRGGWAGAGVGHGSASCCGDGRCARAVVCVQQARETDVLDEESDAAIEVADIALEDKVLLGLSRDARLEVPKTLLS